MFSRSPEDWKSLFEWISVGLLFLTFAAGYGIIHFGNRVDEKKSGEISYALSSGLGWAAGAGFAAPEDWRIFRPGIEVWTPNPDLPGIVAFPANRALALRSRDVGEAIVRWLSNDLGINFVSHRMQTGENLPKMRPPNMLTLEYGVVNNGVFILVGNCNIDGEATLLKKQRIARAKTATAP